MSSRTSSIKDLRIERPAESRSRWWIWMLLFVLLVLCARRGGGVVVHPAQGARGADRRGDRRVGHHVNQGQYRVECVGLRHGTSPGDRILKDHGKGNGRAGRGGDEGAGRGRFSPTWTVSTCRPVSPLRRPSSPPRGPLWKRPRCGSRKLSAIWSARQI